jgi:hypothetical protein
MKKVEGSRRTLKKCGVLSKAISMTGAITKSIIAIRTMSGAFHKTMKNNDFSFGVSRDARRPDEHGRADKETHRIPSCFVQKCGKVRD